MSREGFAVIADDDDNDGCDDAIPLPSQQTKTFFFDEASNQSFGRFVILPQLAQNVNKKKDPWAGDRLFRSSGSEGTRGVLGTLLA